MYWQAYITYGRETIESPQFETQPEASEWLRDNLGKDLRTRGVDGKLGGFGSRIPHAWGTRRSDFHAGRDI